MDGWMDGVEAFQQVSKVVYLYDRMSHKLDFTDVKNLPALKSHIFPTLLLIKSFFGSRRSLSLSAKLDMTFVFFFEKSAIYK